MTEESDYTPPKVWQWQQGDTGSNANQFNRPVSGALNDNALPVGKHPLQLYSMATPNGAKVTIMLEELLALGHTGAEYDAHLIKIGEGHQFSGGFVDINPNSKIPALVDTSLTEPLSVFESGSILLYLAEKFGERLPTDPVARAKCLNWVFWQVGSAPMVGGGFGHFYNFAPVKIKYCIDRFTMETKRQLDVLDKHLQHKEYMCGDDYSIADIMIWPWYGALVLDYLYSAADFLQADSYVHLQRWAKQISQREAVKRGRMVNRVWGPVEGQLPERHNASDFDTKTQDKTE